MANVDDFDVIRKSLVDVFFFQAEDGIRDLTVTGVQTCALPICVVVTASHNPYHWNGIKYKASYGSSALPSIIAQIENELQFVESANIPSLPARPELKIGRASCRERV